MKSRIASEFVSENIKTIFAYALSRVSDRDEAEDLAQDIALSILEGAERLESEDAFYGYVWGIAANRYKKYLRKKQGNLCDLPEGEIADESDFTEDISDRDEVQRLRREISLLSKEYRECTVAYYFDGLSCTEISRKFDISVEMVKYYLFKTRKILKEGINMEREFGRKSFSPTPFVFQTVFRYFEDKTYKNLFKRRLPGQILMSAYYTPMSVRELALELGVATLYLEDELDILEKHGLVEKLPSGKYQTKLVVITDDFLAEYRKAAKCLCDLYLPEITVGVRDNLDKIRALNKYCGQLSFERIAWGLLFPLMRWGSDKNADSNNLEMYDSLYGGIVGMNYGMSLSEEGWGFVSRECAGRTYVNDGYSASAADFSVLPEKNLYFEDSTQKLVAEKLSRVLSGELEPEFMILSAEDKSELKKILAHEIEKTSKLFYELHALACDVLRNHAPKSVHGIVPRLVSCVQLFLNSDIISASAVNSGALNLPDFSGPATVCVYENLAEEE